MSEQIGNPPIPSWYDMRFDDEAEEGWRAEDPIPWAHLPCGCHLRRADFEPILCAEHLEELNGVKHIA